MTPEQEWIERALGIMKDESDYLADSVADDTLRRCIGAVFRRLVLEDVRPCVTQDNHKEAFETSDGISLNTKPETAEPVAQVQRRLFPVLGTKGAAKVDWQFVNDHAGQAYDNHYQTIERLAERGGLSWDELAAIIEGRKWHKMNITEAVETVRRAEAKYLSALSTQAAELDALRGEVERLTGENFLLAAGACINPNGIGLMGDEHGNSFCEVERERIKLDEQVTDLMATIAQLRDRVAKFAEILETVLPYTEAERLREEADVRCGRTYRNPIQKAVNKARALLTQNEVG